MFISQQYKTKLQFFYNGNEGNYIPEDLTADLWGETKLPPANPIQVTRLSEKRIRKLKIIDYPYSNNSDNSIPPFHPYGDGTPTKQVESYPPIYANQDPTK